MKSSRNTVAGLALVELLIAAAMAVLLLAVVLAVYASILNTITVQNRWREKIMPAAAALDIIMRDLACAVIPLGVTNQPFTALFAEGAETNFQMIFYSAFPTASERAGSSNDWRSYSISRVCYSLQTTVKTGEFTLMRKCSPFRMPSSNPLAAGEEKWRGIKKLNIAFFDGAKWTNQWGNGKLTNTLPRAAQVSLTAGENHPRETGSEVMINASRQIITEKSR